jgi:hypothetical protein
MLEEKQQLYPSEALRLSLPIAPVRVKELGLMEDLSGSAIYCTGVFGRLNGFSQTSEEKRSLFCGECKCDRNMTLLVIPVKDRINTNNLILK